MVTRVLRTTKKKKTKLNPKFILIQEPIKFQCNCSVKNILKWDEFLKRSYCIYIYQKKKANGFIDELKLSCSLAVVSCECVLYSRCGYSLLCMYCINQQLFIQSLYMSVCNQQFYFILYEFLFTIYIYILTVNNKCSFDFLFFTHTLDFNNF